MVTPADWAAAVTTSRAVSLPRSRDSEMSNNTRRAFGRRRRCSTADSTPSSMRDSLSSPGRSTGRSSRNARSSASGSFVQSCSHTTRSAKETRPAQPRSPVITGWIIAPIVRTFSITAAEIPEDCTAMSSAMGATPVSIVSTTAFCGRPLSSTRKSEASKPSMERPFKSVTVAGTGTKRERTSKRDSWAASEAANPNISARLINRSRLHSNSHHRPQGGAADPLTLPGSPSGPAPGCSRSSRQTPAARRYPRRSSVRGRASAVRRSPLPCRSGSPG